MVLPYLLAAVLGASGGLVAGQQALPPVAQGSPLETPVRVLAQELRARGVVAVRQLPQVRGLEDLARVAVLEDEEGGMHVRNLSLHPTANEEEALNLVH